MPRAAPHGRTDRGQEPGGLRASLSGLTTRGRSFLAAGIAAAACAYVLGQGELLRVGLLLAVLPLICVYALHRTRYRVSGSRRTPRRGCPRAPRPGCSCGWTTSPGCPPAC